MGSCFSCNNCGKCRADLSTLISDMHRCENCGKPVFPDDQICPSCGSSVSSDAKKSYDMGRRVIPGPRSSVGRGTNPNRS